MQPRSGSSLVAKIFAAHGFNTRHTEEPNQFGYLAWEHQPALDWIAAHRPEMWRGNGLFVRSIRGIEAVLSASDCAKVGVEFWPLFRHLPARVFCVRRSLDQIAKSLSEKRSPRSRKMHPPRQMWSTVRVRDRLLDAARDESGGVDVDVDRIVDGDLSGLRAAFEHHGLKFDEDKARNCIEHGRFKRR